MACLKNGCGAKLKVFKGHDTLEQFCDYVFHKTHRGYYLISHIGLKYNNVFMIDYLIQNQMNPKLLYAGAKVMKFKEQKFNITALDSLLFIPMPLSKLPKTFALQELTEKGYYPHWFNTMANFNYVGPIPDKKDLGYDQMSVEKRTEFLQC